MIAVIVEMPIVDDGKGRRMQAECVGASWHKGEDEHGDTGQHDRFARLRGQLDDRAGDRALPRPSVVSGVAEKLERAEGWYRRYGKWAMLAAWVPIGGDPITVIVGVLRAPFLIFLTLVTSPRSAVIWYCSGWRLR